MPCSFIASDFHTPSNITASKDILILFVLELLIIQINNLDGRDPGSLKFPNSVIFFWRFNPTDSTVRKPDQRLEREAENKEFETDFSYWKSSISTCLFPQLFKCH